MSYFGTLINESPVIVVQAAADMEKPQFLAVMIDGTIATAGANAIGIITADAEDSVKDGDDLTVQVKDIGAWTVGEAVAAGDELTSDASGKAVKATSGSLITAVALEEATAADQRISVQIIKAGYKA
ncbi:MAG: DUF2190 family protein [Clostridiales bacterium]|nr:DUF2190 family protein [Clostridiales bacterium]